jgi:hypothetical protein
VILKKCIDEYLLAHQWDLIAPEENAVTERRSFETDSLVVFYFPEFLHFLLWCGDQGLYNIPVVTRFFWPPDIVLCIASPIGVSAQVSMPINCRKMRLSR